MTELQTTARKRGRHQAVYTAGNGDQIPGLMRLGDGRWRASGPEKFTFTEPDERLAIARFRQWQEDRSNKAGQLVIHASNEAAARDMAARLVAGAQAVAAQDGPAGTVAVDDVELTPAQWLWLREQIYTRREWVAQMVGIEQIAYLHEIRKPEPSPSLAEVGKVYFDRNDVSPKEITKAKCYWEEFGQVTGAATLRDVTVDKVAQYGQKVRGMTLSNKSKYHRFNKVKTVLNNYRTTGKSLDEVRKALDAFAVIRTPETTSLDPHPISRKDWTALLTSQAEQPEGRAMLLCALNLCMYPVDLGRRSDSRMSAPRVNGRPRTASSSPHGRPA